MNRELMDASAPEDRGEDTKKSGVTVSKRRRHLPRKHRVDCVATDASNDTHEKSKDKESTEYYLEVLETQGEDSLFDFGKGHREHKDNSTPLAVIYMRQRFLLPAQSRSEWIELAPTAVRSITLRWIDPAAISRV